ncbi:hypothetical protein MMC11_004961 [Xylographa trunciseda]|nr:hypothetical protein [Xylographa trunciseda]
MSAHPSPVPTGIPGQAPPFAIVGRSDQSGLVITAAAVGMGFVFVASFIRWYVRREVSNSFASDDTLIVVATIFSVLQTITVFVSVAHGFGKSKENIGPGDLASIQKAQYADDILYIITLWLTKSSAALFFMRLTPNRHHLLTAKSVLVVSTVWAVVSVFMIALRCQLTTPWMDYDRQCTNLVGRSKTLVTLSSRLTYTQFLRWQIIGAIDIITEIALFSVAIYMVQGLQMPLLRKASVVLAFSFRLLIIIPIAFRLHYINPAIWLANPPLDLSIASLLTQVELNYGIVAASIPCLRPLMKATATNFGAMANRQSPDATNALRSHEHYGLSSVASTPKSEGLRSASLEKGGVKVKEGLVDIQQMYTSDGFGIGARVAQRDSNARGDQQSMESFGSEHVIIRKAVDATV